MIETLRSGAWLTRERIRLVALAVLAASVIGAGFLIATSNGLNDRFGRPLGTDFSNVYAAGTYVLDGEAAAPFAPPRQFAREQAIFGAKTQFYGWHYPPYFLGLAAAAGGHALPAGAGALAGRDAGALSAGDPGDSSSPSPAGEGAAMPGTVGSRSGPPLGVLARRSPIRRCSSISATVITASSPPP